MYIINITYINIVVRIYTPMCGRMFGRMFGRIISHVILEHTLIGNQYLQIIYTT